MIRVLCSTLLLMLIAGAASAGEVTIHDAWVREPPPGANAAAYLTIRNASDAAVRIVSVSSPAAERVELHKSSIEGGVARMTPVASLEVPAGGSVEFAPGGLHVMLIHPARLEAGHTVPLRFALEGGGALEVEATVRKARGGHAGKAHGEGHPH